MWYQPIWKNRTGEYTGVVLVTVEWSWVVFYFLPASLHLHILSNFFISCITPYEEENQVKSSKMKENSSKIAFKYGRTKTLMWKESLILPFEGGKCWFAERGWADLHRECRGARKRKKMERMEQCDCELGGREKKRKARAAQCRSSLQCRSLREGSWAPASPPHYGVTL